MPQKLDIYEKQYEKIVNNLRQIIQRCYLTKTERNELENHLDLLDKLFKDVIK